MDQQLGLDQWSPLIAARVERNVEDVVSTGLSDAELRDAESGNQLDWTGVGSTDRDEFDVVLTEVGASKIQVIKAVRELTSLGLKEAKDLVDAAPRTIKQQVERTEASAAKELLELAGAAAELPRHQPPKDLDEYDAFRTPIAKKVDRLGNRLAVAYSLHVGPVSADSKGEGDGDPKLHSINYSIPLLLEAFPVAGWPLERVSFTMDFSLSYGANIRGILPDMEMTTAEVVSAVKKTFGVEIGPPAVKEVTGTATAEREASRSVKIAARIARAFSRGRGTSRGEWVFEFSDEDRLPLKQLLWLRLRTKAGVEVRAETTTVAKLRTPRLLSPFSELAYSQPVTLRTQEGANA